MEEIKIVEYEPSLAAAVADMWNKSSSGWNGMNTERTPETVIREHSNAHHLNVFLAVSGDEVIGYCSLDEYTHDEGALYINTLNVRPDYHGKKVGKMLVLNCVKRTVELGWPRLDLYTWPGNTKAVPLYKKCGFFWEKRDNTTHLINFIPTVLKTEAVKDFFKEFDWYNDSKRLIEVKPDGRKENGFDYFEYIWEKSGKTLRMEFERTGRGIRLIETDDYCISAAIENHELVFGRDYTVTYKIVNKSGKPLTVDLKGINDKNITYSINHSEVVTGEAIVKGVFHLNPITSEQKPGRTHPAVTTEISINGRKALFRTGILPAYPAAIGVQLPEAECFIGKKDICYLNIENKLNEDAVFQFSLKSNEKVCFLDPNLQLEMKPGERMSVQIPYLLNEFTYYKEKIDITAHLKDGGVIPFTKELVLPFRGRSGILSCDTEDFCEVLNGPYNISLNKQNNSMAVYRIAGDQYNPVWFSPKAGRPFSPELSNRKPDDVVCLSEGSSAVMKAVYNLNDFPGLKLTVAARLEENGILRRYFQMENVSDCETGEEVWISDSFHMDLCNGVIPYDNSFIFTGNEAGWSYAFWDCTKISENWVFAQRDFVTRGICWEPGQKLQFDSWCMFFEHNLGKIQPGQIVTTPPVTVATGVFGRWQDFRAYVLQQCSGDLPGTGEHTVLEINGGNPFCGKNYEIKIKEYRNLGAAPVLTVLEKVRGNPDIVTVQAETGCFFKQLKKVVFHKGEQAVQTGMETSDGKKVLWADNGLISIRISADFAWSLYSMRYQNNEWLDSSFPSPGIKSWWNPWFGGITAYLAGLPVMSMLEEDRKTGFAMLTDNKGNIWSGLKITVTISKNEKHKGMIFDFYCLMLPGIPVVCVTAGIRQNTGLYYRKRTIEYEYFLKADPVITNNRVCITTSTGDRLWIAAGEKQYYTDATVPIAFESSNRKEKLLIYADPENVKFEAGGDRNLMAAFASYSCEMKNEGRYFVPPAFLIFTEEYLESSWLKDLGNIRFECEDENT